LRAEQAGQNARAIGVIGFINQPEEADAEEILRDQVEPDPGRCRDPRLLNGIGIQGIG
jgi:hypothetical protein